MGLTRLPLVLADTIYIVVIITICYFLNPTKTLQMSANPTKGYNRLCTKRYNGCDNHQLNCAPNVITTKRYQLTVHHVT